MRKNMGRMMAAVLGIWMLLPGLVVWAQAPATTSSEAAIGLLNMASVRASAADVTQAVYPDADDVLVDDHIVVTYEADGTSVTIDDTVVKILTEKGRLNNRVLTRYFSASYGSAEFRLVQVIKPNGRTIAVDLASQSQVMTDPSQMHSNIYDPNHKVLQVTVPGLEIDDLLRYVSVSKIHKPRVPNTFSDYQLLEYTSPIKSFTYDIRAPKELPLQNIEIKSPAPSGTVMAAKEEVGDRIIYRWVASDIPQIFPEPDMPALYTVAQRLLVSTVKRWEDISQWYWKLCEPRGKHTPAMEAKVAELCEGLTDEEAKIRALFRFVSQEIRYVGITVETEAPGYEPHDVALTFENRHGVCRDKAFLLTVMLQLAGFEAFPVLIHAGPLKDQEVPQPFFNHAITAVRRSDGAYLLMDSTDENTKQLLPAYLGHKSYLVACPEGDTLRTSPISPAAENMMRITTTSAVDETGALRGESTFEFGGINDNAYRGMLSRRSPEQRRQFFEAVVKRVVPGARLTAFSLQPEDMQDTTAPLHLRLGFAAPSIMAGDDRTAMFEMPRFASRVGVVNFILGQATLEKRRFPFLTDMACGVQEISTVKLDPTWGMPESLPSYPEVDKDTMTWRRNMTFAGDVLAMESDFTIKTVEFSPEQYAELKQDLQVFEANARKMPIFDRERRRSEPIAAPTAEAVVEDETAEAEVVFHYRHYTLLSAHEYQVVETVRKKILTYKGKKENAELHFSFLPGTSTVRLDYARVLNGNVSKEISPAEINEMDAAWVASAPRYPAAKILVANLPGVEIGSFIEYQVTYHYRNQDFFSAAIPFRGFDPVQQMQVVLTAPTELNVKVGVFQDGILGDAKSRGPANIFAASNTGDGKVEWMWSALRQPAIRREISLPPLTSFVPTVMVSSGAWKEHVQKVNQAIAAKIVAGPKITEAASRLRDLAPLQQVRAVRNLVAMSVRPAGPSFAELPLSSLTTAEQTLTDGYGHSADRAILLLTLLQELRLDAEAVLVASGPEHPELRQAYLDFPTPEFFSEILVRVRAGGQVIWLNDIDQYAVLGSCRHERLPALRSNGKPFVLTPEEKYRTRTEKLYDVSLDNNGAAVFTITETLYGMDYAAANKMFAEQTPEERSRYHQTILANLAQSARAEGPLVTDFDSYPGRVTYRAKVPKYAVLDGDRLYFQLPLTLGSLLRLHADSREYGLYWPTAQESWSEIRLRLPASFTQVRLRPKSLELKPAGAKSRIAVEAKDEKVALLYTYRVSLPPAIIPASEYDGLLEMNRQLNHPDMRTILLRRNKRD